MKMPKSFFLALILSLPLLLAGGEKSKGGIAAGQAMAQGVPAAPASRGPNDRFYAVQAKLDQGGSFYFYSDLKGALRGIIGQFEPMLSQEGVPPQAKQVYQIVDKVLNRLGLYGIHDLGMSTVPEGTINRTKIFISTPEGRKNGIFALLGGDPHPPTILSHVPASTLVLASGDVDTMAAWQLIRQLAQDIAGAQGTAALDQGVMHGKLLTGLDLEAINASLGGEFALLLDQDPAAELTIPLDPKQAPIKIKAPRLAIMIKVKDATFYEGLKTLATMRAGAKPEAVEGKLKSVILPVPPNPVWPVEPALATDGEYVYITSHLALVRELAKPSGPLLRDSESYKRLMDGLPANINGMAYVSKGLIDQVNSLLAKVINAGEQSGAGNEIAPLKLVRARLMEMAKDAISLRINEEGGVLGIERSQRNALQYVAAGAAVPILAAIAVPNFLEAQERAKAAMQSHPKTE